MGIIRLLLAISVITAHSSPIFGSNFIGGSLAVQTFYIISGFYMGLILTEKYNFNRNYSIFLKSRLLKIFPTYWLIMLVILACGLLAKHFFDNSMSFESLYFYGNILTVPSKIYLIFINLFLFGIDTSNFVYFDKILGSFHFTSNFRAYSPESWNFLIVQQAWSISIELWFYLIVPFLNKLSSKKLVIVAILLLFIKLLSYHFGFNHDPWTYRFFPFELPLFILGLLSYRIYKNNYFPTTSKLSFILLISFILVILFYPYIPTNTYKKVFFLISMFAFLPIFFKLSKNNWLDNLLGELSYPIYLIHFLFINIFAQLIKVNHQHLGLFATISSVLASLIIYKFFIDPLNKFRHKLTLTAKINK